MLNAAVQRGKVSEDGAVNILLRLAQEVCGVKHNQGVDGRLQPLAVVKQPAAAKLHHPVLALQHGVGGGLAGEQQEFGAGQLD